MAAKAPRGLPHRIVASSASARVTTHAHHERARRPVADVSPLRLFDALDGLDLDVARDHWRIEVYSVADRARHRWIQLALLGRESLMLTLSLPTSDDVRPIVAGLASWLVDPRHHSEMVQAACVWP
jgi:hypothetical protein